MKKFILLCGIIFLTPMIASAREIDGYENIIISEKYYKTTIVYNNDISKSSEVNSDKLKSYTEEITEEEYNSCTNEDSLAIITSTGIVETTYKKLTTSILSNGLYYRYKAVLNWKNIPKIRSYDTIAIGHYASVKNKNNIIYFQQNYCISGGSCFTSTTFTPYISNTGSAATFSLPTSNLNSLSQTIYFDVEKNTTATIITQKAFGDYSHAIKDISKNNALKYEINSTGIQLDSSISSYYDEISQATASWSGSW